MNKRKCRNRECNTFFRPEKTEIYVKAFWCSPECREAIAIAGHRKAQANRIKARDRAQKRVQKQNAQRRKSFYEFDIKTRRKTAVHWFNKFIRLRDRRKPCVSCGAKAGKFKLTAGHFITAGSCTALRFDERNVHGQCWFNCNSQKSGNLIEYRKGLVSRFGQEILDYLEGPQPVINITVEFYRDIEIKYKAKCKAIEELEHE